jgi:hypothetical protein
VNFGAGKQKFTIGIYINVSSSSFFLIYAHSTNITMMIKAGEIRWPGHAACRGK